MVPHVRRRWWWPSPLLVGNSLRPFPTSTHVSVDHAVFPLRHRPRIVGPTGGDIQALVLRMGFLRWSRGTPTPCISYANIWNYYGSYAHCSLDKGVACAQQQ